LLVAAIVIVLDQWTKTLVRQNLPKFEAFIPLPALGEFFMFQHVDNYGAAFGILQNQNTFFTIVAIVVTIVVLVYIRSVPPGARILQILLGMMLGGAMGNLIDRLQQGYVTDFIVTGIPGFYYIPNYNIADSAIVLGVLGLGLYVIVDDVRKQRRERETTAKLPGQESGL
jgi:signal peptidase II